MTASCPPSAALRRALIALGSLAVATSAQALTISALSPQGEVSRVSQVVAKFNEDAVRFGDAGAPDPLRVDCDNAAAVRGQGRWRGAREWVYQFEADLPPGVRCRVTPAAGFKSPTGADLTGAKSYQFNSGGPFVQQLVPHPGSTIASAAAPSAKATGSRTRPTHGRQVSDRISRPALRSRAEMRSTASRAPSCSSTWAGTRPRNRRRAAMPPCNATGA